MPKNFFQDMVKIKNAKKAEALIVESPKSTIEGPKIEIKKPEFPKYLPNEFVEESKNMRTHYGLWLIAFISIVFFISALPFLFAKAQITVNPKIQDFVLKENLSAIKDINPDGLTFDLVILSGEETKKVVTSEAKDIALKSAGIIVIYNNFSTASQKLATNTKLEGSNGKLYQTINSVEIPGMSDDATPGQVKVGIVATQAGAEYNSLPLDFKILGFKGTPKYTKFYGRSEGDISGGFQGHSSIISDSEKETTLAELKKILRTKLLNKATEQIPNGFILFEDAAFLNIDASDVEFAKEAGVVPVTLKGTLFGFLLDEKELTQKIAKDNIPEYDNSEVYIPNIRDLTFSLSTPAELAFGSISPNSIIDINFNLSGTAKIVWKFDEDKFTENLLAKPKREFDQILKQYPNIAGAELILRPFWIRTLPNKLKDIQVTVNYPK